MCLCSFHSYLFISILLPPTLTATEIEKGNKEIKKVKQAENEDIF